MEVGNALTVILSTRLMILNQYNSFYSINKSTQKGCRATEWQTT
jgi:hypothetical protein